MESSNGAARDSNSLDEWFARGAVSVVVGAPDLGHNEAATTSSNHAEASATNSGGGMNGDQGKSTRRVSLGVGRFDSDANVHLVADNALPAAPEAEEPSRQVSWSNAKTQEMEGQPAQDEEAASSDGSHSWTCDDFNDHGARQTSTGLTRRAGRSLSLQSESMEDYKLQRSHRRRSAWKFEAHELPESTYTWLITENIASRPFVVGLVAMGLSVTSLALVLINQLGNRSDMSPYGLPAGVNVEVRIAQYIGVLIGVLMEEEVPMGLDLIGQYAEQRMLGRNPYHPSKLALSCLARMAVGYLFLACLFFAVLQSSDVLDIFFDVLALEFVERMDDVIFQLSKRGLFGKKLRIAAYEKHVFEAPGDAKTEGCARWMKRLTGTVYFLNTALMIAGLTILTSNQNQGIYRCNSISIAFFDDVWEGAYVKLPDGTMQQRLLVYSHFNGIYVEEGKHDGFPRYVEQNKEDGSPYKERIGAEIIYCDSIDSWVLRHELIQTSSPDESEEENECSWLLRSPQTDDFDIIEVGQQGSWSIWTGKIEDHQTITITCNSCYDDAGCNYHGSCNEDSKQCECDHTKYFGIHCEYDRPCETIRSEKQNNMTLHLLHDNNYDDDLHFLQVYGHPKYIGENMSGIPHGLMMLSQSTDDIFSDDDFFDIHLQKPAFAKLLENYTFVIKYTGRRWYGQIKNPGITADNFHEEEFHGFWDNAFSGVGVDDNATVIISGPSSEASPVALDFFEMRRRNKEFEGGVHNYNYSPFGVMLPLIKAQGAGYFHCTA